MKPEPILTPLDKAYINASQLRVHLGVDAHGIGIPTGIAWGPVERYVTVGLRDRGWPLTIMSLRVCQMRTMRREQAASEQLWTERA